MTDSYHATDRRKYARLLAKTLPAVIETEEQNQRMLREIERLIDKDQDNLSPEEKTLFKLMTASIEDFEEQHYQLCRDTGHHSQGTDGRSQPATQGLVGGRRLEEPDIRGAQL